MPAVVGVEIVAALAFALIAIAATLLVRQLVVSPMRASASGVSGIPAIGGALAWLLTNAANMIEVGLNVFDYAQAQYRSTALTWWNWAVEQTAYYLGIPNRWDFQTAKTDIGAVTALAQFIWYNSLPAIAARENDIRHDTQAVTALAQSIWYNALPEIRGIEAGLRTDVNAVTRLSQDIWYSELPNIRGIEAGIRTDLNAATRLAQDIWYGELPRIRADVNTRARSVDLEALRARVDNLTRQLALLAPLLAIAALDATAITSLRDTAIDPCRCLDLSGLNNLEERVSALELE